MLTALSPLDGRYAQKTGGLAGIFSEAGLQKARVEVEVRYFIALGDEPKFRGVPKLAAAKKKALLKLVEGFSAADAKAIKTIEKKTNHDVKAVEYFLRQKFDRSLGLKKYSEFIHFGLTSEDVNNLAYGLMIHRGIKEVVQPNLRSTLSDLSSRAKRWQNQSLLSLTHGQPATPTTVGKEFQVFADRLERQISQLKAFQMQGKFGGAVGNYAAVKIAYPEVAWERFGQKFVRSLGLSPLKNTTQINPHDDYAELCHNLQRINTILLDFSRDVWIYISRGVFAQKVIKGEVGSSTMPHKVNPIDFENAEGNLGISSALLGHFAEKLPVSRLQRDLSDSTVQRNIGSALGYHVIALAALRKGLGKLALNRGKIQCELHCHPEVLAEPIQLLLKRKGVTGAYEKLKALTRGEEITVESLEAFMKQQGCSAKEIKSVLKLIQ